jgi:hypothetical protein
VASSLYRGVISCIVELYRVSCIVELYRDGRSGKLDTGKAHLSLRSPYCNTVLVFCYVGYFFSYMLVFY